MKFDFPQPDFPDCYTTTAIAPSRFEVETEIVFEAVQQQYEHWLGRLGEKNEFVQSLTRTLVWLTEMRPEEVTLSLRHSDEISTLYSCLASHVMIDKRMSSAYCGLCQQTYSPTELSVSEWLCRDTLGMELECPGLHLLWCRADTFFSPLEEGRTFGRKKK